VGIVWLCGTIGTRLGRIDMSQSMNIADKRC
jgi:hypothetical protein